VSCWRRQAAVVLAAAKHDEQLKQAGCLLQMLTEPKFSYKSRSVLSLHSQIRNPKGFKQYWSWILGMNHALDWKIKAPKFTIFVGKLKLLNYLSGVSRYCICVGKNKSPFFQYKYEQMTCATCIINIHHFEMK
jgi:hypothetical protein